MQKFSCKRTSDARNNAFYIEKCLDRWNIIKRPCRLFLPTFCMWYAHRKYDATRTQHMKPYRAYVWNTNDGQILQDSCIYECQCCTYIIRALYVAIYVVRVPRFVETTLQNYGYDPPRWLNQIFTSSGSKEIIGESPTNIANFTEQICHEQLTE